MDEPEVKLQKTFRVNISERNHNFISVINERTRKLLDKRMRERLIVLVEKLRRGAKI